ncbi:MAG TPA: cobalamin-binding protein [Methylomirabilota bacterium]|jgi:iron complex transport system substrate-binding protein|nr:cobalamin-binding protein [Methylomirabilota bacterium]
MAMYGKSSSGFPRRIVCLTAEHVEICYLLGAGERVVGVPGTTQRPPEAREKAKVGGFTTFRADKILGLEPDLVLAFSDLQADISAELVRAGLPVFCSNQRSMDEILQSILMVGGLLGLDKPARDLVQDLRDEIRQVREFSSVWPDRPRVYFEEWHDPLIAGIRWVSEIIELAGGRDIFPEVREKRSARERVVDPGEVIRRDPQIILASWCGKPVDIAAIAARPGWERISAVKEGHIHELGGADILSPGPSVLVGLRRIHEIVQSFMKG